MPTHFPPLYSDIADLAGKDLPNPVPTILATVLVLLVVFIGANVGLWWWAQKNAPAKPKKVRARLILGWWEVISAAWLTHMCAV
jgi:hypothetical protein